MTHTEMRAILEGVGLSQAALARELGVSYRTVKRWAAGTSRIPAPAVRLLRVACNRGYWPKPRQTP